MTSTPKDERRDQLIACASAVAKLAKHRKIEPVHVRLVRDDLEIRSVVDTSVKHWTQLTQPVHRGERASSELHRERVVPALSSWTE